MEDISSIAGIVVLAASIAISYIGNRKKQAARPRPHEEAWPAEAQAQPMQPARPERRTAQAGGSSTAVPTARQQRKSEASGRKPHAETRTEKQRLQKGRGAVPHAAAGIETGEIGHEEVAETRPEFDLRQAVVYAEILKPKFEEEQ